MKKFCYFLFTAAMLAFTACSSDDNNEEKGPLPFTIAEKDIQIEDARAIEITSGNLDYTANVEDPSIVRVAYHAPYEDENYGNLFLIPRKMGKTVVTVTDNVCKITITLQVEVLEKKGGRGALIEDSNHPLLAEGNMLVFCTYDTSKQFFIKEPQGDAYITRKEGRYILSDREEKKYISLTYKNDSEEEVTEVYDISKSDPAAISSLATELRWAYEPQTKMASPIIYHYLRMDGCNNEFNITAIAEYGAQ